MILPGLAQIQDAARIVQAVFAPTPEYAWPLLGQRIGAEVWVKHEDCTPAGAFKIRGGLAYFEQLARANPRPAGVISATRGNHGQSVGFAARRYGFAASIVVPHGNSREKNEAMRALGVELIVHGDDFQAAREHAQALAQEQGLHLVPSFHPLLVTGVATYCLEFLCAVPDLDVVYVPIGMGSGVCAMIAARDALGLRTQVVGVVSALAPAYALSFARRRVVPHAAATALADGMACRQPDPQALKIICAGAARIVQVDDGEVAAAMRMLFECTHHVAEGAGAAALAAVRQEAAQLRGQRVGVVLSGGNVDRPVFAGVLAQT